MKPIKLDKFPVTASDGTEYRVTIEFDGGADVRIEFPTGNRWFNRYRTVFTHQYRHGDKFDRNNPDYVALVNCVFTDWELSRECSRKYELEFAERRRKKAVAVEAFRQWNGKITESK